MSIAYATPGSVRPVRAALRILPVLIVSVFWTMTMTIPRTLSRLEAWGVHPSPGLVDGVFFVAAVAVQLLTVVVMLVAAVVAWAKLERFWEGLVAAGALFAALIAIQFGAVFIGA